MSSAQAANRATQAQAVAMRLRRLWVIWLSFAVLLVLFALSRGHAWRGSAALHTGMEALATVLALIVGVLALARFTHAQKPMLLFLGAGFLGTALLDGVHALLTAQWVAPHFAFLPERMIPWSWSASRTYLAMMLLLSWWSWRFGIGGRSWESRRLWRPVMVASLLLCVAFVALVALPILPPAYQEGVIGRPQELLTALVFALALAGFWRKGAWQGESLEYWLILALVVSVGGQALFMAASNTLFDVDFDVAHLLKIVSYLLVLGGLLVGLVEVYEHDRRLAQALRDAEAEFASYLNHAPVLAWSKHRDYRFSYANEPFCQTFQKRPAALIGLTDADFLPQAVAEQNWRHDDIVWQTERKLEVTEVVPSPDGASTHWYVVKFPIRSATGSMTRVGGMALDITDRVRMEEALREQTATLQRVNQELEQFAYVASHDLKAPLRGIRHLAEWIEEDLAGRELSAETRENLGLMNERVRRMEALINGLLAYSRLGRVAQTARSFSLRELIDDIAQDLDLASRADWRVEGEFATLHGDPAPLRQVLQNLLTNASQHTDRAQPRITLTGGSVGELQRLVVCDDGPGIAPEHHGRVFQMFQSLHPKSDGSSTGMGLALVAKAVDTVGGSIRLRSPLTDGRGACFEVVWPIHYAPEAASGGSA